MTPETCPHLNLSEACRAETIQGFRLEGIDFTDDIADVNMDYKGDADICFDAPMVTVEWRCIDCDQTWDLEEIDPTIPAAEILAHRETLKVAVT